MNLSEEKKLTAEDIWAMFAETARRQEESRKEHDRMIEETNRKFAETDRKIKEVSANIGGISKSNGEFAEEYFFNSLEKKKKFANIHFDDVSHDLKNIVKMPDGNSLEDQFDIVMLNDNSVALIEIKYKADKRDIKDLAMRKLRNFRILFPNYKNFKIYLGLGSFSFSKAVMAKAKECGVGLLKQVGESIEYKADWDVRAY